jgi:hypothetical protein
VDVGERFFALESDDGGEIELREYREIRAVEDGWILQRLVLTFSDGQQHRTHRFADIVARGADKVADVLDEEKIDRVELPS